MKIRILRLAVLPQYRTVLNKQMDSHFATLCVIYRARQKSNP